MKQGFARSGQHPSLTTNTVRKATLPLRSSCASLQHIYSYYLLPAGQSPLPPSYHLWGQDQQSDFHHYSMLFSMRVGNIGRHNIWLTQSQHIFWMDGIQVPSLCPPAIINLIGIKGLPVIPDYIFHEYIMQPSLTFPSGDIVLIIKPVLQLHNDLI